MRRATRKTALFAGLLLCALLAACGGGGGGGDKDKPEQGGGTGGAGAIGGSGGDSGGGSSSGGETGSPTVTATTVTLSKTGLKFEFLKNNTRIEANKAQALNVAFTGDVLRIAYAPGAAAQNWLYIPPTLDGVPSRNFSLPVEAFPTTQAPGTYRTSVRLESKKADGSGVSYVDLPVELVIHDNPVVYSGSLSFSASEGASAPAAQVVSLDFGSVPELQATASIDNGNSIGTNWLQVSLNGSQLTVQAKPGTPPGDYNGYVNVSYTALGGSGSRRIPVSLTVAATNTVATYATLSRTTVGQPAKLVISGHGFSRGTLSNVKFGAVSADTFQTINDTQIVAQFSSLPASGSVQATIGGTVVSVPQAMDLSPAQQAWTAADLSLDDPVGTTRLDPIGRAIVVATTGHLYRLEPVGGAWTVVASRTFDNSMFDFSPDYQELVVPYPTHLAVLDARTLALKRRLDLPNEATGGIGFDYVSINGVMANGDVVLNLSPALPGGGVFAVYRMDNQTLSRSATLSSAGPLPRINNLRDKLMIVPNRSEANSFSGFYQAHTRSFVSFSLSGADGVGGNQVGYAGDGSMAVFGKWLHWLDNGAKLDLSPFGLSVNYPVFSPDGSRLYTVDEGAGLIKPYLVQPTQVTAEATVSFTPFSYYAAGPGTIMAPDGKAVILYGGWVNSNTREKRVVIVPLP